MLKFLLKELERQNGPIAQQLHERLVVRIGERRNKDIVSLMKYLTNKDLTSTDELPTSSKRACHTFAINLFLKAFENGTVANTGDDEAPPPTTTTPSSTSSASEMSHKDFLSEQLRLAINREQTVATSSSADETDFDWESEMEKTLRCELAFYEYWERTCTY